MPRTVPHNKNVEDEDWTEAIHAGREIARKVISNTRGEVKGGHNLLNILKSEFYGKRQRKLVEKCGQGGEGDRRGGREKKVLGGKREL